MATAMRRSAIKAIGNPGLLALEAAGLGEALRWEPSRGGALFPHLYDMLRLADVAWARPLPLSADGAHVLPEGVA